MDNKSTTVRGKIVVRLDNVKVSNDEVRMKLSANLTPIASMCCAGINNPYFIFSRARDPNNAEDFVRVFKGPVI